MAAKPGASDRIEAALARLPFVRGRQPEALPVTLDRKRIYVLPTRQGLLVGVILLAMLLGALNYNNNPGLLLAFLLLAVVHNGAVLAHLRLSGLSITALQAEPVHAGDTLQLRLRLTSGARSREGVGLRVGHGPEVLVPASAEAPGGDGELLLALPAPRRGLLELGRLRVSTTRPLGLARAWSWLRPAETLLVYPALEAQAPPLPGSSSADAARPRAQRSGEDTHHLRDYRSGDAPRQIAWKSSARLDRLLVREYEAGSAGDVELEWPALRHLPYEARIARLARWVVDAERAGRRYRLVLPSGAIGPARGSEHRHACLRALALLPEAGA
ncbi:MAG TPA: DUF58 domain-containing protein [Xanthomonadaceae bacterium]|jgi:uncharacterized protein (DUF58 family)|nr:DUF58 domain-containing protein [Xanthomonadaceae bacterium]